MWNWFQNLSLVAKSTLLLSLAAIVFLLLLSSGSYYFARQELLHSIATNQTTTITSLAGQLDDRLRMAKNILQRLATHLQADHSGSTTAQLQEVLKHYDIALQFFDAGLTVLSPEGRIVAILPYQTDHIGKDASNRSSCQQVVATHKPCVSSPFASFIPPYQTVVAFNVPIFDSKGRLSGVLSGHHSLKDNGFLEQLIAQPVGKSGYFYLFNHERTLLLHPDPSRILTNVAPGRNQVIDDALQGWFGTRENTNSRGVPGLTSVQPLKEAPWFLAAHYPLSEAYAPLIRAKTGFGLLLVFTLLFSVVAVWLSMQPVVRPLQRLTNHLANLGSREGAARFMAVTSKDEIGQLSKVFNDLLQELDDDTAALEEAAEVYRIVTEFTSEVSIWQLENGDIRYISPNCAEVFGYLAAEFYADPQLLVRMIYAEDQALWYAHSPGSCTLDSKGLEIRMVDKDGALRHFRHYCHPVTDQSGNANGIRISWLDITGQHSLERTMRRLSRAVEQSASIVVMTNTDGLIEYVNPAFCLASGYAQEEVMGQPVRLLQTEHHSPQQDQELWSTISSGQQWRGEFCNQRKDGSRYWVDATISPLFGQKGKIEGYLSVQEDTTLRKEADQRMSTLFNQMTLAKREWEQTLDHLHDFVILTDTHHRIRRYNRILADMSGRSMTDLVGFDWRTLLQEVGFSFNNFNGVTGELLHQRSERIYDISVYPIKAENDELQGFVISMNDTTELRSTTQELEQALAELGQAHSQIYQQEKLASIGQLAAGVAHEINNPMGYITSNLGSLDKYVNRLSEFISVIDQSMQECGDTELKAPVLEARKRLKIDRILDDAHHLITESQDGAARVRRIVQDLKSFSRVDQAETALIDLNEALDATINIAWNEIKYVADLKREFGDIPKVRCFPQQLNQVFLNLLVNAAHAMGDVRGEISVHTEQDGDQVLVKISDTGCGMPPEVQRRIFEPFFTTKEVGKGTGLGLSISYDIIRKHGGSIDVVSEEGRGTVFTVHLPLHGDVNGQNTDS